MLAGTARDCAKRVDIARHGSNENVQAGETRRIDGKEKMTHLARRRDIVVDHFHKLVVERRALQSRGKHSRDPGEGARLLASSTTALGGRIHVNTGGRLLSRGHPIGATGAAQIVELADQLRGRSGPRQVTGARFALAENGGGFLATEAAAVAVHILEAPAR